MTYKILVTTVSIVFDIGAGTSVSTLVIDFPSEEEADFAAEAIRKAGCPSSSMGQKVVKLYNQ